MVGQGETEGTKENSRQKKKKKAGKKKSKKCKMLICVKDIEL